jgi:tetratricopeptide (TPR) repeat protein
VESLKDGKTLEGTSDKEGHFAVAGMYTGYWRITASKRGYKPSSIEMRIRQLKRNPPITFTVKKMEGFAALLSDESALKLFEKGNQLTEEEKYDEALAIFNQFLTEYPEVYQVHLNTGKCYLKKGELDKAEANFQLVLDKTVETHGDYTGDPDASLRAFTGLGEVAIQREDYDSAQKYFGKALEISPEDEQAALNVGEILFSNQKIDEAIHYYDMAIQIKPDWSKPYLKLGYVYLNKADYEKALEYFNKFITMDPENPEVPTVNNIIATIEKLKE